MSTPLMAYLPEFPSLGESLLFQFNGLVVVLLALSGIWGVMEIIGLYFKRATARVVPAPVATAAAPAVRVADEVVPPETIVVIAAAVHACVNGAHRIASVKPADAPVDWAREGRRQIFASHKLR